MTDVNLKDVHYDENFIPGTINILHSQSSNDSIKPLKRSKHGIILMPQPSDSPNDPLNWSFGRKFWHFALLSFITALTAATSNDAGAAQDSLNQIYGISYDSMNTGAGVLFLFIGWSCIFFAPASSLYGRRITYIICLLAGTLGSVWFAVSNKTSDTVWSQAFVGMSEACAEAQVQQSLADIFFQHQLGSVLTVYILATSVGSFLGPLIAHLIAEAQTFRWVGWWGAIFCGGTLVVVLFTCEETVFPREKYGQVFEAQKDTSSIDDHYVESKEKNHSDGEEVAVQAVETTTVVDPETHVELILPYWKRIALITPSPYMVGYGFKQYVQRFFIYFKVFTLPAVWISGLLWGLQDSYMTFFLTTQDTFFYDDPWNKSETGVAVMNVATTIGAIVGCFLAGIISDKHVVWIAKRNNGVMEPEYRLWLLFITLIVSPAGLIMFGVGADRTWPWQVIYVGLGFIGFGWGSIGDTAMSYLMDSYPEIVIQGMVGVSIINNTLGSIFTFVCSYWLDASGTTNTYITLAVIDFVTIAVIVPTLIWGKSWRKRTRNLYIELIESTQSMD
jgi:MFS family permease